jgi:hypothetical protein
MIFFKAYKTCSRYDFFKRIHALIDSKHLRRLSGRFSIARFLALKLDGKEDD